MAPEFSSSIGPAFEITFKAAITFTTPLNAAASSAPPFLLNRGAFEITFKASISFTIVSRNAAASSGPPFLFNRRALKHLTFFKYTGTLVYLAVPEAFRLFKAIAFLEFRGSSYVFAMRFKRSLLKIIVSVGTFVVSGTVIIVLRVIRAEAQIERIVHTVSIIVAALIIGCFIIH